VNFQRFFVFIIINIKKNSKTFFNSI